MLAIRLQRVGTKNRPSYRVVVSENKRDMYGRHNEILGNYDPVAQPKVISLKEDRIKYWLSVGAQPSATVHNLLVKQGVLEGKKIKAWTPKKKAVDEKAAAAQAPKPEAAAPAPKAETPEAAGEKPAPEAPAEKAPAAPAEAPKA